MTVPAGRMPAAPAPRRRPGARPRLAPKRRGRVRTGAEYLALRVVMGLLGALPLSVALRVGELGALLAYAFDVSHRRTGMVNLGIAFPERPVPERRRILRCSFLNLGRMAAELAHLPGLSDERLRDMVRFEDEAWWQQAVGWERSTRVLGPSGH